MKKIYHSCINYCFNFISKSQSVNKLKKQLVIRIEQKSSELTKLSDNIWEAAEVAFREEKSAEYLIELCKR